MIPTHTDKEIVEKIGFKMKKEDKRTLEKQFIKKKLFSVVEDLEGDLMIVDEHNKMICFWNCDLSKQFIEVFEKDPNLSDEPEMILKARNLATELKTHIE